MGIEVALLLQPDRMALFTKSVIYSAVKQLWSLWVVQELQQVTARFPGIRKMEDGFFGNSGGGDKLVRVNKDQRKQHSQEEVPCRLSVVAGPNGISLYCSQCGIGFGIPCRFNGEGVPTNCPQWSNSERPMKDS